MGAIGRIQNRRMESVRAVHEYNPFFISRLTYRTNKPALAAIMAIERMVPPIPIEAYPVMLRVLQASQPD